MKRLIPLLLALLFIPISQAHSPKTSSAEVEKVAQTYLNAFKEGRLDLLKKSCTSRYLQSIGGTERIQHILPGAREKYRDSQVKNLRTHEKPQSSPTKELYLHFEVFGPSGPVDASPSSWFLIKKQKDGSWKIDAALHDFDPDSGES